MRKKKNSIPICSECSRAIPLTYEVVKYPIGDNKFKIICIDCDTLLPEEKHYTFLDCCVIFIQSCVDAFFQTLKWGWISAILAFLFFMWLAVKFNIRIWE